MNTFRIKKVKSESNFESELRIIDYKLTEKSKHKTSEVVQTETIRKKHSSRNQSSPCLPTIGTLNKKKYKTTIFIEPAYKGYKLSTTTRTLDKGQAKTINPVTKPEPLMGIISYPKLQILPPISNKETKSASIQVSVSNEASFYNGAQTVSLISPSLQSHVNEDASEKTSKKILCREKNIVRDLASDPYHVNNIMKNPKFTTFACLLDFQADPQVNPFQYFEKAVKIRASISLKKKISGLHSRKHEKIKSCSDELPYLMSTNRLKLLIPCLSRLYYHPKNIFQEAKIIIVNLFDLNVISSRILKKIKKIMNDYQIVFVVEEFCDDLLAMCKHEAFHVSGIYLAGSSFDVKGKLDRCLDYSQIYLDFACKSVYKNVLIVTCHLLADGENAENSLVMSQSFHPKILAERIPVPCIEYSSIPITFLLPRYSKDSYLSNLHQLVRIIRKKNFWHSGICFPEIFGSAVFCNESINFYSLILADLRINWKKYQNFHPSRVVYFI